MEMNSPQGWTMRNQSLVCRLFHTLSCVLLGLAPVLSQTLSENGPGMQYQLLFRLPIKASQFTTDKLQHIYYIDANHDVVKLDASGTELFRYINQTLGEPAYLDATNPFNLLLFFPDYQNVITLDRTMNLAGQFNLFQLGLFQVHAIGASGDGNLWVYDELNFRLKKIGQDGQVILQSADLSLDLALTIRPNLILERGQTVFINDPEKGIFLFDVFGQYLKTLPITGLDTFQVIGDQLYYFRNGKIMAFHLKALLESEIALPDGYPLDCGIRIEKNRLYIHYGQGIDVYNF